MGTDYYAAIPWGYIDLLHTGDATGCMLCTYVILHRLADWGTGRVERVSAQGLSTWSEGAFNPDTFSRALLRMERQNHITREITPGSHKSYPVIIHNYEASIREPEQGPDGKLVKDSDGRVVFTARKETINLKEWRTWAETKEILGEVPMRDPMIKRGSKKAYDQAQGSTSRGRSEEGTDDGTDEATERTISKRAVSREVNDEKYEQIEQGRPGRQRPIAFGSSSSTSVNQPAPPALSGSGPVQLSKAWRGSCSGYSEREIEKAIQFHLVESPDPWYRGKMDIGPLSQQISFVRNNIEKIMSEYKFKAPSPIPTSCSPNCPACHGTGQATKTNGSGQAKPITCPNLRHSQQMAMLDEEEDLPPHQRR